MEYTKPKVTIDLEEYNALLEAKGSKYDPNQVASVAATIMLSVSENRGIDKKSITDGICRDLDYTVDLEIIAGYRGSRVEAKVYKKPISR